MNIKTVSSAYFIPLVENLDDGSSFTRWINLATIHAIAISEAHKNARVVFDDKSSMVFTGDAYLVLKSEMDHLYQLNHKSED